MKMGRILILAFILTCGLSAAARTFDYDFRSTPLSEALALLARQHPDVHVRFIYNELEGYRVTARIHTDDAYTALRQITARQPVSSCAEATVFTSRHCSTVISYILVVS